MGIGLKALREFQIFLAGWSARQKSDDIRRDIVTPINRDESAKAFQAWQVKQRLARTKQIRKRHD